MPWVETKVDIGYGDDQVACLEERDSQHELTVAEEGVVHHAHRPLLHFSPLPLQQSQCLIVGI